MIDSALPDFLAHLPGLLQQQQGDIVLGYSGGLDSTLLLAALVRAGAAGRVRAVHVHHGLSDAADLWASHCREQCQQLGVSYAQEQVLVSGSDNLEARARDLRRAALMEHVGEGGALWLAQHQDDQAETLLLRLLRGAGSRGLGGMSQLTDWQGRHIVRPLLNASRRQLEALASDWQLQWVEDDSNQTLRFDRNFLRIEVLPKLRERWPAVTQRLAAAAERLREDAQLLDELAAQDLASCGLQADHLSLTSFSVLSAARQRNALRGWLAGHGISPPATVVLQRVLDEILTAAPDREPLVIWPDGVFTRFRDQLYLLGHSALSAAPEPQQWRPATGGPLVFGAWTLMPGDKAGEADLLLPAEASVQVTSAKGGERLLYRGMHRQVSELWRQAGIPPWERRQLPLLFDGDKLVAAARIGVADDVAPAEGQPGLAVAVLPTAS